MASTSTAPALQLPANPVTLCKPSVDSRSSAVGQRDWFPVSARFEPPRDEIANFCRRWQVKELALFGSALREDFGPDSDVDLLVRFHPDARRTLLDMAQMQEELSLMFGRQADLIEHDAVQSSRNYIRRNAILRTAETVYAA